MRSPDPYVNVLDLPYPSMKLTSHSAPTRRLTLCHLPLYAILADMSDNMAVITGDDGASITAVPLHHGERKGQLSVDGLFCRFGDCIILGWAWARSTLLGSMD